MDTADHDTLVTRTYDRTYYEPPVLPEADRDPNSDTRVPKQVRNHAMGAARIAFDAAGSNDVAVLAAVEEAYAAGYEAGVRSTQLMGGILTNADEMAYYGSLPTCDVQDDDGVYRCNRAFGHIGDHAELTDDDRAGEDDPWHAVYEASRWSRTVGTFAVDAFEE